MSKHGTLAIVVVSAWAVFFFHGCAWTPDREEDPHEIGRRRFAELSRVLEEGDLRAVKVEIRDFYAREGTFVVESKDPEVLRRVLGGLRSSTRRMYPWGGWIGCGFVGTLTIYGRSRSFVVNLTGCGFSVWKTLDTCLFDSWALAQTLDDLVFSHTERHLPDGYILKLAGFGGPRDRAVFPSIDSALKRQYCPSKTPSTSETQKGPPPNEPNG